MENKHTQEAIKRAVENGLNETYTKIKFKDKIVVFTYVDHEWDGKTTTTYSKTYAEFFMSPDFWSALGRSEGWGKEWDLINGGYIIKPQDYLPYWHDFLDHLIAKKPIEEFFKELLVNKE